MNNAFSISEFLTTLYAFVITKIFYRDARLIRRPFYVRGISSLNYGKGFTTGHGCRFDLPGKNLKTLIIGDNCRIGDYVHIVACENVQIGNNCLMASKIFISDTSHGSYSGTHQSSPIDSPNERELNFKPVTIGENVWIGENVCILPGVKIGNGCIIGANSVVNNNILENCIAVGIPAKVIKKWNEKLSRWEKVIYESSTDK